MTLFEFVSVMASIVLGLSLAVFIQGAAAVARDSDRVTPYFPHSAWALLILLDHFLVWWAVWDYRDVEWNFGRFLALACIPLVLLFLSAILFPRRIDRPDVDLASHFFRIRRVFMAGFALLELLFILDGPLVFGSEPIWHPYRTPQLITLIAAVIGFFTVSRAWHVFIALTVITLAFLATVLRFMPGAFS